MKTQIRRSNQDLASKNYNFGQNYARSAHFYIFNKFETKTDRINDLKSATNSLFSAIASYDAALSLGPNEKFSKKIMKKRDGLKAYYAPFIVRQHDSVNKLM